MKSKRKNNNLSIKSKKVNNLMKRLNQNMNNYPHVQSNKSNKQINYAINQHPPDSLNKIIIHNPLDHLRKEINKNIIQLIYNNYSNKN